MAFPIRTLSHGTELLAGLCATTDLVGSKDCSTDAAKPVPLVVVPMAWSWDSSPVPGEKGFWDDSAIAYVYMLCVHTHRCIWT